MAEKRRIRLLLQDLAFGGTQRQALELAARLDPEAYDVRIWTLIPGRGFEEEAGERSIPFTRLGSGTTVGPGALAGLFRALGRDRPHVLVLLTVVPNIWGRILGRVRRVPVIIANSRQSGNPGRQHEWLLKRLAHHHVCNARALKEQLVRDYRVRPERISVIHNGVDADRFMPPASPRGGDPLVLSLGRLVGDKDQASLIRAFSRISGGHPGARLAIHGDGPLREELAALAGTLGCAERVDVLPAVEDVIPLLHRAHIFAMSSLREGFPNVIAEAMAAGLPVVSTDVDGVPELVVDGETGLLAPAGDVEGLARGLDAMLSDPERARAMGALGRERVERDFTYAVMAGAHASLFEQLLSKRSASRRG